MTRRLRGVAERGMVAVTSRPAGAAKPRRPRHNESRRARDRRRSPVRERLGTAALLIALVVALLTSVPGLRGVAVAVRHIDPMWVLVAVALELASELSFVAVFRLFFDRLSARDGRRLAWTSLGSGVLLPGGGAGGLAIGGWLIHLTGQPVDWILRRSSAVFIITSFINGLSVILAGGLLIAGVPGPHGLTLTLLPVVLTTAAMLPVALLPFVFTDRRRRRLPRWLVGISDGVRDAEAQTFTRRPNWRLLGSLGYQWLDIAALFVTLHAVGARSSVPAVVLGYTIGYLANAVPIPGGIGALDAGLTGALALYGVSPARAAAGVLVYHAVALWVPGIGGLYGYARLRPHLQTLADTTARADRDPRGRQRPRQGPRTRQRALIGQSPDRDDRHSPSIERRSRHLINRSPAGGGLEPRSNSHEGHPDDRDGRAAGP